MSRPRFEWKYVTTGRMIDNKTSKIFDTKDECLCLLNDLEAQLAEAREVLCEYIERRGRCNSGVCMNSLYDLRDQLKERIKC